MNDWQLLNIRLQMESLVTEREGMIAENQRCAAAGERPTYGELAFRQVQQALEHLVGALRG